MRGHQTLLSIKDIRTAVKLYRVNNAENVLKYIDQVLGGDQKF